MQQPPVARRPGRIRLAFLLLLLLAIARTAWVPLATIIAGVYLAAGTVWAIAAWRDRATPAVLDALVLAGVGAAVLSS